MWTRVEGDEGLSKSRDIVSALQKAEFHRALVNAGRDRSTEGNTFPN